MEDKHSLNAFELEAINAWGDEKFVEELGKATRWIKTVNKEEIVATLTSAKKLRATLREKFELKSSETKNTESFPRDGRPEEIAAFLVFQIEAWGETLQLAQEVLAEAHTVYTEDTMLDTLLAAAKTTPEENTKVHMFLYEEIRDRIGNGPHATIIFCASLRKLISLCCAGNALIASKGDVLRELLDEPDPKKLLTDP